MQALLGLGVWGLMLAGLPPGADGLALSADLSQTHGAYSLTAPYVYRFEDGPYLLSHEMKIGGSFETGFSGALYWFLWESQESYDAHPDVADCIFFETLSAQVLGKEAAQSGAEASHRYSIKLNSPRGSSACTQDGRTFIFGDTANATSSAHPKEKAPRQGGSLTLTKPSSEERVEATAWRRAGFNHQLRAHWSFGGRVFLTQYMVGSAAEAWALPELLTPMTLESSPRRLPSP